MKEVGGINLGQGVCNLPVPEFLIDAATRAMRDGHNRYTDPRGTEELRVAISGKLAQDNQLDVDPNLEVLATCGATGAFEVVCGTFLNPGDRVVVFEPTYPYHVQALLRYGAEILRIPMQAPNWEIDFALLGRALVQKPKFVLLNTPGNPTGKVWTTPELDRLAALLEPTDTLLVTDEIYEYMVFDGASHHSPGAHPRLNARTIAMGGFSKTFAITGWRIGYLVAPEVCTGPLSRFLDAVYVCPPAPLQQAVALAIETLGSPYFASLAAKYQAKRDLFSRGLAQLGFDPLPAQGAYYLLAGYEGVLGDVLPNDAADLLIERSGIGAVPSSDFVVRPEEHRWLRFCVAHPDEVLEEAIKHLGEFR